MKIKSVVIGGFRGYKESVKIEIKDLCVFVGKNDIGKSTIMEALDIFFNEGWGAVKLDKNDVNKDLKEDGCIEIGVEFCDLPEEIVVDYSNKTKLKDEYLLTDQDTLFIIKRFPGAGKPKIYIKANHPVNESCKDLLTKKIQELKKIADSSGILCDDKTKSSELRKAIWNAEQNLECKECEIEIAKIESKDLWEKLKAYMPLYTLFQSDRENNDSDNEVQDPIKLAVKEILEDQKVADKLKSVAEDVGRHLEKVAERTISKLKEFNPEIAATLRPKLLDSSGLKWNDVFKNVSIAGDDDIPINKRGSGVKRLVLISFFRAEAERRRAEKGLRDIVYAIEEPETAQHPEHQRKLIKALIDLSKASNAQVLLTTHSPEIVKRLDFDNIKLVSNNPSCRVSSISPNELPYPSLNEINFSAFSEATPEYHNELYGFIEAEGLLGKYKIGKSTKVYKRREKNGNVKSCDVALTEYIRHQIHHPENKENELFTDVELRSSIEMMRDFIKTNRS